MFLCYTFYMHLLRFSARYLLWHYTLGVVECIRLWRLSAWFVWHFFGIGVLAGSIFMPIGRPWAVYEGGFDTKIASFLANFILGTVGALVRLCVIAAGFGVLLLLCLLAPAVVLAWIFAPVLAFGFLFFGLIFLVYALTR